MDINSSEILKHLYGNGQLMFFHLGKDGKILECNDFTKEELGIEVKGKCLDDIFFFEEGLSFEILKKELPRKKLFNYKIKHNNPKTIYLSIFKGENGNFHCLGELDFYEYDYLRNAVLISHAELSTRARNLKVKLGKVKGDLQSKDEFLSMTAHDLRNPLGVISSFSNFLLEDAKENLEEEQISIIEKMHDSSNFMLNLLNDLLDLSKIEAGRFEFNYKEVNLTKLILKIVELNSLKANEKNIQISFSMSDPIKSFFVDPGRFEQVLNNLLSNAIKFSALGTVVSVKVLSSDIDVVISVKDSGQGIPKEELKKLFNAYQTTSIKSTAGEKNTGLGLAIAQKVMIAHGGTIWVESEVGTGSTFFISLPITNEKITEYKKSVNKGKEKGDQATQIPDGFFKNIKVLIGEDDPFQLKMLGLYLKNKTQPPTLVENGQKVVDLIKIEKFDIIIIDEQMPVLTGIEAIKIIREIENAQDLKRTPIISLSASNDSEIFLDAGADEVLKKPINKKQLLQVIYSHIKK